jgi:hypothetical protein
MHPHPRSLALAVWLVLLAGPTAAQVTETPQTIAPGRFHIKMDGLKLGFDRAEAAGNKYEALGVASTVVSAGLTSSIDLQLGFDLFLRETYEFRGHRDSHSGFGDLAFRTKWTFWRDPALGAAAIIPYVKLPTNTGGVGKKAMEGGFILPFEFKLGEGASLGAMFQWDMVRNDDDNGYDAHWLVSSFVERHLTEAIAVYGEATIDAWSTGLSNWAGSIGGGVWWQLTKSTRLDYELLRGVNQRATDWTHVFRVNWDW